MAKMTIEGLEELSDKIDKLSKTKPVTLDKLFTRSFMKKYSKFSTFEELCNASDFKISNQEEFDKLPQKDFDAYIASVTKFRSFRKMLETASSEYFEKLLGD